MSESDHAAIAHLLRRLNEVAQRLDRKATAFNDPHTLFAEALDPRGVREFLAIVAADYGMSAGAIEECAGQPCGTVAELAARLPVAGRSPGRRGHAPGSTPAAVAAATVPRRTCWLAATAARLPDTIQSAASINQALQRPAGWLERHAGIEQRHIWAAQDPLAAGAEAGRACLEQAGLKTEDVGGLLVTSEAPPVLTGLAAALHHRLRLGPHTVALEVGGACTGFLTALWTGQALLASRAAILVVAVEAPSQYLQLQPGPAGENAALFGDAAAAAVLCAEARGRQAVPLSPVLLGVDGTGTGLLQVQLGSAAVEFRMRRIELASRAIEAMTHSVRDLADRHGLELADLAGIVAHGGNGRLPGLLARKLGLPPERIWSETPMTGNLGSASLPVAWALRQPRPRGPVIWTAVGAGLMWGAALVGQPGKGREE